MAKELIFYRHISHEVKESIISIWDKESCKRIGAIEWSYLTQSYTFFALCQESYSLIEMQKIINEMKKIGN